MVLLPLWKKKALIKISKCVEVVLVMISPHISPLSLSILLLLKINMKSDGKKRPDYLTIANEGRYLAYGNKCC